MTQPIYIQPLPTELNQPIKQYSDKLHIKRSTDKHHQFNQFKKWKQDNVIEEEDNQWEQLQADGVVLRPIDTNVISAKIKKNRSESQSEQWSKNKSKIQLLSHKLEALYNHYKVRRSQYEQLQGQVVQIDALKSQNLVLSQQIRNIKTMLKETLFSRQKSRFPQNQP